MYPAALFLENCLWTASHQRGWELLVSLNEALFPLKSFQNVSREQQLATTAASDLNQCVLINSFRLFASLPIFGQLLKEKEAEDLSGGKRSEIDCNWSQMRGRAQGFRAPVCLELLGCCPLAAFRDPLLQFTWLHGPLRCFWYRCSSGASKPPRGPRQPSAVTMESSSSISASSSLSQLPIPPLRQEKHHRRWNTFPSPPNEYFTTSETF